MNKYHRLASNTVIFAIGTFSSKLLVFLLLPYYTRILTETQLSISDLVVQTANLLIPITSLGISSAIVRYGLDRSVNKRSVFTSSLVVVLGGYGLFLLCSPLLAHLPLEAEVQNRLHLVYLYVLGSSLRWTCAHFVRARELVRLYAVDGILSTITVILFNLLFLSVFSLGVTGYVLATVCSDLLSAAFLFWAAKLRRFVRWDKLDFPLLREMLRYAVPLIPANVLWWVINVSDHYFVAAMVSVAANGLYVVAYKVPTMITLVSGIFTDAWQLSAFTENPAQRNRFFTSVFQSYAALIFTAASGLLLMTKVVVRVLTSDSFYGAWQYVPLLVLASSFSCLVTFLGSVYLAEKRSARTLTTTALGAVCNVLLNLLLIPQLEVNGAALATFFSFFVVFLVRILDVQQFVRIRWQPGFFFLRLGLLSAQVIVLLGGLSFWQWVVGEILLFLVMLMLNLRQLVIMLLRIFYRKRRPRAGRSTA